MWSSAFDVYPIKLAWFYLEGLSSSLRPISRSSHEFQRRRFHLTLKKSLTKTTDFDIGLVFRIGSTGLIRRFTQAGVLWLFVSTQTFIRFGSGEVRSLTSDCK